MDDYATMTEEKALDAIQLGILRDLARKVNSGDATGQELNVARGLLRDNRKRVTTETPEDLPEDDINLPPGNRTPLPERKFGPYEHDE